MRPPQYTGHENARRRRRDAAQPRGAQKVDQRAADSHLAAHIHEDGHHAERHVGVFQCPRTLGDFFRVLEVGYIGEPEKNRQQHEDTRHAHIGNLRRRGAVRPRMVENRVHEVPGDLRTDRGAEGIDRLREIQSAGSSLLGTENGHIRVGRDLQHRKTQTHDEERNEKQRIGNQHRRREEPGKARCGNEQPDDHAVLVAKAIDGITGLDRDEVID